MTHEYGDPIGEETIAAAVKRAVALAERMPGEPLDAHVEQALHECVCACAVDIEDAIEHGQSGMHATLFHEVRSRAKRQLRFAHSEDEAFEESFPGSDPLAWIWEKPPV